MDLSRNDWVSPQVFLRESLEHRLEKQRELEVLKAAMVIQAHMLGYVAR